MPDVLAQEGIMFKTRNSSAVVVGGAAVIIALSGCAGASGSAPGAVELHQERALAHSAARSSAAEMQGQRLAEYAEARATTAENSAADMQGQRLAAYAEARATTAENSAAEMQGQRLAAYAEARAAAGTD